VQVPLQISARFTARVALAEILSLGAEPLAIVLTLSVEPYPFLQEAREGIQEELATIGKEDLPVLFSSEKNMKTRQTGLGVTVVGRKTHLLPLPSFPLFLYALGVPSCGPEVLAHEGEIADLRDILCLRTFAPLILPVGSQGVFCEALTVARELGAKLHLSPPFPYSLFRSCGPATVCLFGSQEKNEASLPLSKPVWRIGTLWPV
ncbi:MAG: hypothetical protein ACP5Q4_10840, partial [Candidatus Caldatribacteriaceae bacterium]